ncbi:MAG: D-aminoacylase [Acidobacteriia bacterium]|nr:D-aminoacylase [Terriglobia bacterium]
MSLRAAILLLPTLLSAQQLDLLLRGGQVIDGSGSAARTADVGIRNDRIVLVGDGSKAQARRTIDVKGLIVSPGFIDPHAHVLEDLLSNAKKSNEAFLMQGVTTTITGNDGAGPIQSGATLAKWTQQGIGTNAAVYIGQGTVRREVMGMSDAAPSAEQVSKMKTLVARGVDEGAMGMSTGLYYAPGSYATSAEVIELAKAAAAEGGIYDSHLRDEDSYTIGLLGAVSEAIRIAREAKIPVHISHIKALGPEVWGKSAQVIELIRRARAEGLEVTADQYPYTASGSSVTASLVPRWAEVGGNAALIDRIGNPAVRPKLTEEMEANLKRRGGADSLLIISGRDKSLIGKRLAAIAIERHVSPVEAALEIIKNGGAGVASFNMSEPDIENFMRQDWVMTGSDGSEGHPRKYGTFPRKLRIYVNEKKLISLPYAIHSSTSLTAQTLHLADRGLLREGYFADVIAFDPATVADRATYEQPDLLATGMKFVIVNGQIAVEEGKYTGKLAGRALRHARK